MKKILFTVGVAFALALASCSTITKTAYTEVVDTNVRSCSSAELVVSPKKVSYTLNPSASIKRGGIKNCKQTAVAELLKANGNADVLVAPRYEIKMRGRNVKYVTVEGYPATYVNVKPACSPVCK